MKMKRIFKNPGFVLAAPIALGMASGAAAEDVDFSGTVGTGCTLAVSNNGTLALSTDGQTLGSEETGGTPAVITVLSLGANTLTVNAPSVITSPVGYDNSGETVQVAYVGASGLSAVNQAYTDQTTNQALSVIPLSALTINARIQNAASFAGGAYTVRTVVTCS